MEMYKIYIGGDFIKNNVIKEDKIRGKQREITLIIVTVIVLVLFFSGVSIGKQISSSNIKVNTEIAEPIIEIENNPSVPITAVNNKGQYDFIIKNYNKENKITEVDILYTIEIISKLDESISIKIYKDNKELQLNNYKTENIQLGKENKEEHHYKLEIEYDKSKSVSLQDIIEDLQIKVHSEQKKA